MALVPKQHNGLGGRLPRRGGVGFEVRFQGIGVVVELGRFHHVFQDAAHVAVHFLHGQPAFAHAFEDALNLHIGPGVHEVVSGLDGGHGVVLEAPVRNDNALVAPFVAEDACQELVILLGVQAVKLVVGAHDRPGTAFLHGNLEVLEVNFPEGAAAHQGVVLCPVGLLVVGRKVFGRCAHAVTLDAPDIGGGHLPAQQRVFREVLEVAAAQRVAMDVHAGSQQHVHTVFQRFIAQYGGGFLHQFRVPGTGHERPHGKTGGHMVLRVPRGVDAYTRRTVGKHGLGDA